MSLMSRHLGTRDHPESLGGLGAHVLPAMGRAPVEIGAVARLQHVRLAIVVERDLALDHVEELHLSGLDDHLVGLDTLAARAERGDHRADLALEEPGAQHVPLAPRCRRRTPPGSRASGSRAAARSAPPRRARRWARRARPPACPRVWSDGREPSRLDLRDHAGREPGLLRELALLELALGAQRLDPLAERRHAPAAPRAPGRPASRRSARATKTRVIFLR